MAVDASDEHGPCETAQSRTGLSAEEDSRAVYVRLEEGSRVARCSAGDNAMKKRGVVRLGVIADTHGLYDRAIEEHFSGVTAIVHAGDIGDRAVIEALKDIRAYSP